VPTPIRVGAVLSLSGAFAAQGNQARRGLILWVADVNAAGGLHVRDRGAPAPLDLRIYDDTSRSNPAAAWAEALIVAHRADLLVGPYSSVLTLAVAPVAERHRRVLWNHGGATDAITRRGFRFVVSLPSPASRYFAGILEMARALEPAARRIALVHGARGTFPRAVVAGAEAYACRHGLQILLKAPYPPTEAALASLAAEVVACRPDVVLGVGRTEADLAFARQLRAQGVGARLVGLVAAPAPSFAETLGPDADGFVGPSQWEPGVRYAPDLGPTAAQFVARFRARFGTEPDYPAAQAYAAGLVAQRCVEVAGTLDDEAVRAVADELALTTFYGAFKLDAATGVQIRHALVVVQWQDAAKPIVWPPAVAEARPRMPIGRSAS
jgi:branched-chain amino acid transport system substrate-binding protein